MSDSGWNMYVFRDGRRNVRGTRLISELQRWLQQIETGPNDDLCLGALIAAGELECALADVGAEQSTVMALITDELAEAVMGTGTLDLKGLLAKLSLIEAPDTLSIAVAEGFAYYALHPFRLAEPIRQIATGAPVRIIGLRSIGATLSAVAKAVFSQAGSPAERITVRPTGHPYDRKTELTSGEQQWLHEAGEDALVVIVDEGPGLSGSSFLSVAEAVEHTGIPPRRIVMLGSRYPDLTQMRAPNAMQRWPRFRFFTAAPGPLLPPDAAIDLTGGSWRHQFWEDFDHQPAAWTQLEPAKYMSKDRRKFYKFHGYGHFGEEIASRAAAASESGFSPEFEGMVRGFGKYRVERGRLCSAQELSPELLRHAAEYCAFRIIKFVVPAADSKELATMAKWNWQCEFGTELPEPSLSTEHPVIADGRMLPHEWLLTDDGRLLKLDGATHGDDHFFPGPCDIAWDLAGMIVEWELNPAQSSEFLEKYRELSGDDARKRVREYVLIYAIFRMAWSKMAARASSGSFDEKLLFRDYMRYRTVALTLRSQMENQGAAESAATPALKPAVVF